ncbi:hypothetical protein Emed_007409 [Eimeria media]
MGGPRGLVDAATTAAAAAAAALATAPVYWPARQAQANRKKNSTFALWRRKPEEALGPSVWGPAAAAAATTATARRSRSCRAIHTLTCCSSKIACESGGSRSKAR